MKLSNDFCLEANNWVIKTHWFYIFLLGFTCLGLNFQKVLEVNWASFVWLKNPLLFLFVLALLGNTLLYLVSRMTNLEATHRFVPVLSSLQVIFEIILISLLLYWLPETISLVAVLLFIPVVESVVLFGEVGSLVVAVLMVIVLNIFVILVNSNLFQFLLAKTETFHFDNLNTSSIFIWPLVFSAVYLVVGLISSYTSKQILSREENFKKELIKGETQMDSLKNFNKELEKKTREIEAKDFELKMANNRLEKLEEAKLKFVSVTAHQLRTPLSAIKWTFDIILTGRLGTINDEQKEFLAKGFESTQRMIHIVNDLLCVDHVDIDKSGLTIEKINLNSLLESVRFEFTNQLVSKEIDLEIKQPEKPLPEIEGDQIKLRIVLENLIDNAIKYTPKGGNVVLTISDAKLNTADAMIEIIIKDSGIGIPESEKSKIFSKFFRSANAVSVEPDGSGVGLFISKDIIEKHGGLLWYKSSLNEGTSFYISLPLRQKLPVIDSNSKKEG